MDEGNDITSECMKQDKNENIKVKYDKRPTFSNVSKVRKNLSSARSNKAINPSQIIDRPISTYKKGKENLLMKGSIKLKHLYEPLLSS